MVESIVLALFVVMIGGIFAAGEMAKDRVKGVKRRSRDYLIVVASWPIWILKGRKSV